MRLRRENGDFDFIVNNGSGTIQPKLFPEQLVGQIVIIGNVHAVITAVNGANGAATYQFVVGAGAVAATGTYTVATGEVTIGDAANH